MPFWIRQYYFIVTVLYCTCTIYNVALTEIALHYGNIALHFGNVALHFGKVMLLTRFYATSHLQM